MGILLCFGRCYRDGAHGNDDYDFIDDVPSKYVCTICTKVLRNARLTECCGQHFCDSCLGQWMKQQGKVASCPTCRTVGFQSILNRERIREINELRVRCTFSSSGCEWVGELGMMKTHLDSDGGCEHVQVHCDLEACDIYFGYRVKCGMLVERRLLEVHKQRECTYRQFSCVYCNYVDTYDSIAGSALARNRYSLVQPLTNHYATCGHYPIGCVNKCGTKNIKRKDMMAHRGTCLLEPVECRLGKHIPRKIILRKDMKQHVREECEFRPYKCQYCTQAGTYLSITGQGETPRKKKPHYSVCPNFPITCPNKCGAKGIQRKNENTHRKKCPLEIIECPFSYANCKSKILRKDVESHCQDNMPNHVLLLAKTHQELLKSHQNVLKSHCDLLKAHQDLSRSHEELSKSHRALSISHSELAQQVVSLVKSHETVATKSEELTHEMERLSMSNDK